MTEAGTNRFYMSVKQWIVRTNANIEQFRFYKITKKE
jgi:hypothetical protein